MERGPFIIHSWLALCDHLEAWGGAPGEGEVQDGGNVHTYGGFKLSGSSQQSIVQQVTSS